nr:MAG TPA: hypothetical protein [Caudoviricetes sp.]
MPRWNWKRSPNAVPTAPIESGREFAHPYSNPTQDTRQVSALHPISKEPCRRSFGNDDRHAGKTT